MEEGHNTPFLLQSHHHKHHPFNTSVCSFGILNRRDSGKTSPLGFRFQPAHEEPVYYLKMNDSGVDVIPLVDVCKWEPWEFPAINTHDLVWLFSNLPDCKYSKVFQGFCFQAKYMAEYGSVTDMLESKNRIRESKKDSKDSENPIAILNSIWNELVGKHQKGSFNSQIQILRSIGEGSISEVSGFNKIVKRYLKLKFQQE